MIHFSTFKVSLGYYISIPYLCIYSCVLFFIGVNEYPFYLLKSYRFPILLLSTFICYLLFFMSVYFDRGFSTSYLNYIAFLGVILTSFNLIFLINEIQPLGLAIEHLVFQFIHLYSYLAHLLSVQFELNSSSE